MRRYLRTDTAPRFSTRQSRPSKLDPFKDYLQQRVAAAHPNWIPAMVLFDEIHALGYRGDSSILRAYMATLKPRRGRCGDDLGNTQARQPSLNPIHLGALVRLSPIAVSAGALHRARNHVTGCNYWSADYRAVDCYSFCLTAGWSTSCCRRNSIGPAAG